MSNFLIFCHEICISVKRSHKYLFYFCLFSFEIYDSEIYESILYSETKNIVGYRMSAAKSLVKALLIAFVNCSVGLFEIWKTFMDLLLLLPMNILTAKKPELLLSSIYG